MLGDKGCDRRSDTKWKVISNMGIGPLKAGTEASIWKAWRAGSEIQNQSWLGQSSGWGIQSWAGRVNQTTSAGPVQPQPFCDSVILVLFVPKKGKRLLFWMSWLTRWVWSLMFHLPYLNCFIPILIVWFHHLEWQLNWAAVHLCRICVRRLAQTRKSCLKHWHI